MLTTLVSSWQMYKRTLEKEIYKDVKYLEEEEWGNKWKEEGNGEYFLHGKLSHASELQDFPI
jgi:hypothetical protein